MRAFKRWLGYRFSFLALECDKVSTRLLAESDIELVNSRTYGYLQASDYLRADGDERRLMDAFIELHPGSRFKP